MKWVSEWKWGLVLLAISLIVRCGKPAPDSVTELDGHWLLEKYEVTAADGKVFEGQEVSPETSFVVSFGEGRANLIVSSGLKVQCNHFTYRREGERVFFEPVTNQEGCSPAIKLVDRRTNLKVEKLGPDRLRLTLDNWAVMFIIPYKTARLVYTLKKVDDEAMAGYYRMKSPVPMRSDLKRERAFAKDVVVKLSPELGNLLKAEKPSQPIPEVLRGGNLKKDPARFSNFRPKLEDYAEPVCELIHLGGAVYSPTRTLKILSFRMQSDSYSVLRAFLRTTGPEVSELVIELVQGPNGFPGRFRLACRIPKQISSTGEFEVSHFLDAVGDHVKLTLP